MKLHEIFSPALARQLPAHSRRAERSRGSQHWYDIIIDDAEYQLGFLPHKKEPGVFTVGLSYADVPHGDEPRHARLLFAEVVRHLTAFLDKVKPQMVILTPETSSRRKLYDRILNRFLPEIERRGYTAVETNVAGVKSLALQRTTPISEMSMQELRDAEYVIEYLFKDLGLDVIWTTHFKDRVQGREDDVTKFELIDAFKKMKQKYGDRLRDARDNHEEFVGVLKDIAAELNIPFAIDFDRRNSLNNKYKLRGITIMRKNPDRFVANVSGGAELKV